MRKFVLIMVVIFIATASAYSKTASFSLSAGPTYLSHGYINADDRATATHYAGFSFSPDWRFCTPGSSSASYGRNLGLRLSVGSAWAYSSNTQGYWDRPLFPTCNVFCTLTPYYEFIAGRWSVDLGAVLGFRVRVPSYNEETSTYLMTFSADAGVDIRLNYRISDKWYLFAQWNARRRFFDYLYQSYYYQDRLPVSGCLESSFGLSYCF